MPFCRYATPLDVVAADAIVPMPVDVDSKPTKKGEAAPGMGGEDEDEDGLDEAAVRAREKELRKLHAKRRQASAAVRVTERRTAHWRRLAFFSLGSHHPPIRLRPWSTCTGSGTYSHSEAHARTHTVNHTMENALQTH